MSHAISSIDGRYFEKVRPVANYFSEETLMKYRTLVECEYLISLSLLNKTHLRKFTLAETKIIRSIYEKFNDHSYQKIKSYELKTNHDVKAVEYFIKDELSRTSLKDTVEWVHFALTSEDTNNVSYALMLSQARDQVLVPEINNVLGQLKNLSKKHAKLPMLARTHGQSASPTTFGKELRVFASRIEKQLNTLRRIEIEAKLNGATGNYNAHYAAYPKIDWMNFSKRFLKGLGLSCNLLTTQIEPHDSYIEVFDAIRRINVIMVDFNQDIWRYISDGWVVQRTKPGETGSSTMPHKVNPIDFENSEGNLGLANALFEFFARKLPISRLQRDLSDSTVERTFGTAFAHSFLAYKMLRKGLDKISVNEIKIREDLNLHLEVVAEAIQTILRREGAAMPYEKLKELTRGKEVTQADLKNFIEALPVSEKVKEELFAITPLNYTGLASRLASM